MPFYLGLILVLTICAIGVLCALVFHVTLSNPHKKKQEQDVLDKAQKQADQIIANAIKKGNDITVQGELTGIKYLAREKIDARKLQDEYEKRLNELLDSTIQDVIKSINQSKISYESALQKSQSQLENSLQKQNEKAEILYEQTTQTHIQKLHEMSTHSKEQFEKLIDEQTHLSQTLKEEFHTRLTQLLDTEGLSLIAEIAQTTIGMSLTDKDYEQLIQNALEDAKAKGMF